MFHARETESGSHQVIARRFLSANDVGNLFAPGTWVAVNAYLVKKAVHCK